MQIRSQLEPGLQPGPLMGYELGEQTYWPWAIFSGGHARWACKTALAVFKATDDALRERVQVPKGGIAVHGVGDVVHLEVGDDGEAHVVDWGDGGNEA